jgi:hypothetical protein
MDMSALDRIPTNINFFNPSGFVFQVKKLPNVNFFVQEVTLPSITLPSVMQPNPFVPIPRTGDTMTFEPLSIAFKLDENLEGYLEVYRWMTGLGFPEDFSQYKTLADKNQMTGDGLVSDVSLILLTNLKNPNIEFTFRDASPTFMSPIKMTTKGRDIVYQDMIVTFQYTLFDVAAIPKGT